MFFVFSTTPSFHFYQFLQHFSNNQLHHIHPDFQPHSKHLSQRLPFTNFESERILMKPHMSTEIAFMLHIPITNTTLLRPGPFAWGPGGRGLAAWEGTGPFPRGPRGRGPSPRG